MTLFRPALPLIILSLLAACDDGASQPDTSAGPATGAVAQKPTGQAEHGLAGIWKPNPASDLQALVLQGDGQLYLVGDGHHQGVNWRQRDDGALRFNYLSRDGTGQAASDTLTASLDKDSLALQGDSPFAGHYRRDNQDIETVTGKVILPADARIPDPAVLAITVRELRADGQNTVVDRRLTRLPTDRKAPPFRLYFGGDRLRPDHHYGVSARVIAGGVVQLTSADAQLLPADTDTPVTLILQSPDRAKQ